MDVFGFIFVGRLSCLWYLSWGVSMSMVALSSVEWISMLCFSIPGKCAITTMSVPSWIMSINGSCMSWSALSVSGSGCPNWRVKCLRAFSLSVGVSSASFMMSSIIFSVLSDSV